MLLSVCFLNDNNNINIITSYFDEHYDKNINDLMKVYEHYDKNINDLMKVYDLAGKKIKNIRNSLYSSYFIDTYYDNKKSKNYIISGNKYNIVSYDYEKNKKYYEYCIDELNLMNEFYHYCIFIDNSDKEILKLIESSQKCRVGIWDFHTGKQLWDIILGDFSGMFLLNNNQLFLGYQEGYIKIKKLKMK